MLCADEPNTVVLQQLERNSTDCSPPVDQGMGSAGMRGRLAGKLGGWHGNRQLAQSSVHHAMAWVAARGPAAAAAAPDVILVLLM
jgi:hypothetical protein